MKYQVVRRTPVAGNPIVADWLARSTAAGVTYATDFSGPNDFDQTNHVFGANDIGQGGPGAAYWKSLVSHYTGDPLLASALRIDSPASSGANGASWITSLNPTWTSKTQGFDTTGFYVSVRTKFPTTRLVHRTSDGFKFMDISAYDPQDPQASKSHTNFEIVTQNVNWHDIPICYRDDGNGQPAFAQNFVGSPINDIVIQDIDRGVGVTPNTSRYCLYNNGSYGAPGDGCWKLFTNEWIAHKWYIEIPSYNGTSGNRFKYWSARQGDLGWTLIYDQSNFTIGQKSDGYTGGFCGAHFNAYETNLTGSFSDTYQLWSQFLVSLNDIACPASNA